MLRLLLILCVSVPGCLNSISAQESNTGDHLIRLADSCKKRGQSDSAIMYYQNAADLFKKKKEIEKEVNAYNQIGIILTREDKYSLAQVQLEKAFSAGKLLSDSNNLFIATTYISLGVLYNALQDFERSLDFHYRSLAIRLKKLGENNADVATSYGNIGNVFLNYRKYRQAVDAHLKAMNIREKLFGAGSTEITQSYIHLGTAYKELRDYDSSIVYYRLALGNKTKQVGEKNIGLSKLYRNLSDVYYLIGNKMSADSLKLKAEQLTEIKK